MGIKIQIRMISAIFKYDTYSSLINDYYLRFLRFWHLFMVTRDVTHYHFLQGDYEPKSCFLQVFNKSLLLWSDTMAAILHCPQMFKSK